MPTIQDKYLHLLKDLVAIPSVSAQRRHLPETAQLIARAFIELGGQVTVDNAYFAPLVIAQFHSPKPDAKTLLIYNHYDVQPAEPLDLWESDPWQLRQAGDFLFGRGVNDDKGNLTARITALAQYLNEFDTLPVNITFIVEGAEESASLHLNDYLAEHPELQADLTIWESGNKNSQGQLEIIGGNKGIITFNISSQTGQEDLHSSWAGIINSATWRLIAGINCLRDQTGQIQIPNFNQTAQKPNQRELDLMNQIPFNRQELTQSLGLDAGQLAQLSDQELKYRLYFEPTLNIEGFASGYHGPGVKTILPHQASAKLDVRLIPGMTPQVVLDQIRTQLNQTGFTDLIIEETLSQPGYRSDMSNENILKVIDQAQNIYPTPPVIMPTSAGTGPMAYVHDAIPAPIVGFGVGNSQSRDHAPNENIRLTDYQEHIQLMKALIASYQ